ncbi:MAG: ABC transporter permease [Candidatus Zixiibacteriota bacterium]
MYKIYLFLKRSIVTLFSYKTALALGIVGSFVGLLQFSFMGKFLNDGNSFPALQQYGGNLLSYLIIGTAFTSFLGVSLSSFQSTIRSEQQMGTLEFLLMSNTRLELILIYSGLMSFLQTLLNVAILLAIVIFVFSIPMNINIPAALLAMLLTITSMSGIGLISAGIIIVTKVGDPISWAFTSLTGLFSGVMFPVEYLPVYLRPISAVLPTTYALHALRMAITANKSMSEIAPQLMLLATITLITLPLGLIAVRLGYNHARRTGSLAQY